MVNKIGADTYTYDLVKKGLDVSALRAKAIANNIANINTKGYKRFNVSFENTLKDTTSDLLNKGYVNASSDDFGTVGIERDYSTSMRMDGNNVDIDIEKTNQAANTLLYNALVTSANNRLSMMRTVINGSGR